jgi:hypothetical protein
MHKEPQIFYQFFSFLVPLNFSYKIKFLLGAPYPRRKQRGITGAPARPFGAAAKIARLQAINNSRNTLPFTAAASRRVINRIGFANKKHSTLQWS